MRKADHLPAAATKIEPRVERLDRSGKHVVAAHIERDAYREFKMLAAEQLKTTDALVHEAIALLFEKHGRSVPTAIKRKLQKLGVD